MLSCLLNGKRINCYDYNKDNLKKWSDKNILLCPVCNKPYEYCHGKVIQPYFRHKDKEECLDRFSESETEEHKNGKKDIYEWLKKQEKVTDVILEGWIPETKQRPDIMFKYNNIQYVIEFQCTPISSEYYERHELYEASGIKDIWICGVEKYLQSNMRDKVIEKESFCYYNYKNKEFLIDSNNEMFDSFNIIYKKGKFGFSRHYLKNRDRLIAYSCNIDNFIFKDGKIFNAKLAIKLKDTPDEIYRKRNKRKELNKMIKKIEKKEVENKIDSISIHNNKYYIYSYKNYGTNILCGVSNFDKYKNTESYSFTLKSNDNIYLQINDFIKDIKENYSYFENKIKDIDKRIKYFSNHCKDGITLLLDKGKENCLYDCKYKKIFNNNYNYCDYSVDEFTFWEEFINCLQFLKNHHFSNIIMIPNNLKIRIIKESNISDSNIYTKDLYSLVGYLYLKGFKNIKIK